MPYVYSTLTADQNYCLYDPKIDFRKIPKASREVFVAGGSNVINQKMDTPRGVATLVTDEQLKVLEQIKGFQRHKERGFISVDSKNTDAEKVAKNMTPRDKSAQLEGKDYKPGKQPVVNTDG